MNGVSIVIATFNASSTLAATLESIADQCDVDWSTVEVIVVDGGSSDSTVQIARNSGICDRIVSEPDRGVYDAMNKGAAIAQNEWLHFQNAGDTFYGRGSLAEVMHVARDAASGGHPWFIAGAINESIVGGPARIPSVPHRWSVHALGLQPHCHQATWFRRDVFAAMGGHSLELGTAADYDMIIRFGLVGRPHASNSILVSYQGGGMSAVGPIETSRRQHAVRVVRFELAGALRIADAAFSSVTGTIRAARVRTGRVRRRIQSFIDRLH